MAELCFSSDTKQRKQWFTGVSFSHPAKLVLPLQLWLIENYTKAGELILDPMAGSGTVLVGCSMGRHVVAVELESKFVDMMRGNWVKIQERGPMMGYQMGTAQIIQGDARNLPDILVDKCIFSPPYAETLQGSGADAARKRIAEGKYKGLRPDVWVSRGNVAGSTFGDGYSKNPANLSNLPYGSIDKILTSPPYEASIMGKPGIDWSKCTDGKGGTRDFTKEPGYAGRFARHSGYSVDAVITSPPYEHQIHRNSDEGKVEQIKAINPSNYVEHSQPVIAALYSPSSDNIGNLRSDSYLAAMLQVYQNCFAVLKPGGLMILVTKNFLRNQKEVRLDEDTIKLCEQVGFTFRERHYRRLTQQSFWRVIYASKYPLAPKLDREDILIFLKPSLSSGV